MPNQSSSPVPQPFIWEYATPSPVAAPERGATQLQVMEYAEEYVNEDGGVEEASETSSVRKSPSFRPVAATRVLPLQGRRPSPPVEASEYEERIRSLSEHAPEVLDPVPMIVPPSVRSASMVPRLAEGEEEDIAERLTGEFHALLIAELRDSARTSPLSNYMRYALSHTDQGIVREALEAAASTFATYIHREFGSVLDEAITTAQKGPRKLQRPIEQPRSEREYQNYLGTFVEQNLSRFHSANDQSVQDVAKRAHRVRDEVDLSEELIPGLAKLALYDFVILCDNSHSMLSEDRIPALRDTLGRVAKFATILSPDGISIRILNNDYYAAHWWDNLKTVDDVHRKMAHVSYDGSTPLGTRLRDKIVEPMILAKAQKNTLKKPVIVVIITDGEPTDEDEDALRDSIRSCHDEMRDRGYEDASVVFLISRVGTSDDARLFVEGLGKDPSVGSIVYVSPDDLAQKRAAFERSGTSNAYTELLIKLFLSALKVRTK